MKQSSTETKNHKNRILNNVNQLYNDYFDLYRRNYNSANVRNEEKRGRNYKQFEIIGNRGQEPKSTKKEGAKTKKNPNKIQKPLWIKSTKTEGSETKKPNEIQKPLWTKLNKNDFDSLTEDVYNLNNDEFKTTVERKSYYLRNVKMFLLEITTKKIGEEEALKLYSDLIIPDIAELEKSNSKSKDRRANILNVLNIYIFFL